MRFISPPLLDTILINRLPDLLRTRRSDGSFVLEKSQTTLLKGQPTVIQHRTDFCLDVAHQRLIDHTMDAARQNFVVVRHQLDVIAIKMADIFEGITEVLPSRKILFEIGKTAGQGMASCVDDFGVRQARLYQTDVQEVIGHLIDEKRAISFTMNQCAFQILAPKRF